jgi:hypothetical protein
MEILWMGIFVDESFEWNFYTILDLTRSSGENAINQNTSPSGSISLSWSRNEFIN